MECREERLREIVSQLTPGVVELPFPTRELLTRRYPAATHVSRAADTGGRPVGGWNLLEDGSFAWIEGYRSSGAAAVSLTASVNSQMGFCVGIVGADRSELVSASRDSRDLGELVGDTVYLVALADRSIRPFPNRPFTVESVIHVEPTPMLPPSVSCGLPLDWLRNGNVNRSVVRLFQRSDIGIPGGDLGTGFLVRLAGGLGVPYIFTAGHNIIKQGEANAQKIASLTSVEWNRQATFGKEADRSQRGASAVEFLGGEKDYANIMAPDWALLKVQGEPASNAFFLSPGLGTQFTNGSLAFNVVGHPAGLDKTRVRTELKDWRRGNHLGLLQTTGGTLSRGSSGSPVVLDGLDSIVFGVAVAVDAVDELCTWPQNKKQEIGFTKIDYLMSRIPPLPSCSATVEPTTISTGPTGGERTIAVNPSAADCEWSQQMGADWSKFNDLRFSALGKGTGSASITIAPNRTTASRSTVITVAGKPIAIQQAGCIANDLMCLGIAASATTPSFVRSGTTQEYTLTFNHDSGYTNLGVVNVLVNTALDGRNACYLAYSQPLELLYLVRDAGPASGLSRGLAAGSVDTISNTQCSVTGSGLTVIGAGSVLTLKVRITFLQSFFGNKAVYTAARDRADATSGWHLNGLAEIPEPSIQFPRSGAMMPTTGRGVSGTFDFSFMDEVNAGNLNTVWMLLGGQIDGRNACLVAYYVPGNELYLYPDSGDGNLAARAVAGTPALIENSQCRIDTKEVSASRMGNTLIVRLPYSFRYPFRGSLGAWTAGETRAGRISPWTLVGAWNAE